MQDTLEDISLTHDNGEDMHFRGPGTSRRRCAVAGRP